MLLLHRKVEEALILRYKGKVIGRIVNCGIDRNRVQLGIDASRELEVNREEIDLKKHPEDVSEVV